MGLGPTPISSPLPAFYAGVCSGESHRPNEQPQGKCSGTISCLLRPGDRSSQMPQIKKFKRRTFHVPNLIYILVKPNN